jgi:hypothetical protein
VKARHWRQENSREADANPSQQEKSQAHLDGQRLDAALDAGGDEGAKIEAAQLQNQQSRLPLKADLA